MELDPRSLIAASVLSSLLLGLALLLFARLQRASRIAGAWAWAMLVLAIGLAGLALRGQVPDWISIVGANTAVVAALVLALRSLRIFVGSAPRDRLGWGLTGALGLLLLFFSEIRPNFDARVIAVSTAVAIIAVRAALLLRRSTPAECRLSGRMLQAVFWLFAAITGLRIPMALSSGTHSLFAPDPLNSAIFLSYAGFIIIGTLGVLAMEIEALQSELVRAARFDALTGLHNRGAFQEEFAREASRAGRSGAPFSLALFDLDRFKAINDQHGHPVGDQVLRAFADVLRSQIRRHDTACRYGGEEFALLMPHTGKETAAGVAERVRVALATDGISVGGRRIDVTVSGGVALYGADGTDWEQLMTAVDAALYAAKHAGRNRIVQTPAPAQAAAAGPDGIESAG